MHKDIKEILYTEEEIKACLHSSFDEYLESKNITLEDYNKLMEKVIKAYVKEDKSQEEIKVAKIKAQDIIVEAQKTAENEKNKIINATKEEVRNLKIAADKDIEESRRRAKDDIKREIIDVAFQASEKILQREINEDDNEKVLNNFIDSLNEEEK